MDLYSRLIGLSHGSIRSCARHLFYLVRSQYSDMHYCIMVSKTILIFCLVVVNYSYSTKNTKLNSTQTIQILLKEFQMKHPIIITSANSITTEEINLLKFLHQNGNFCNMYGILRSHDKIHISKDFKQSAILFVKNSYVNITKQLHHFPAKMTTIVMLYKKEFFPDTKLNIDQEIFFFEIQTMQLYESYSINKKDFRIVLGAISQKTKTFEWKENVNSNLIKRRSNFHGLILKGMAEFSGDYLNADPKYRTEKNYFSNNKTYLVNGYIYGLFYDIFREIEDHLNFTTLLYKNEEEAWGYIYPQPNGTYRGTGVVGDVFFQRADLGTTIIPEAIT